MKYAAIAICLGLCLTMRWGNIAAENATMPPNDNATGEIILVDETVTSIPPYPFDANRPTPDAAVVNEMVEALMKPSTYWAIDREEPLPPALAHLEILFRIERANDILVRLADEKLGLLYQVILKDREPKGGSPLIRLLVIRETADIARQYMGLVPDYIAYPGADYYPPAYIVFSVQAAPGEAIYNFSAYRDIADMAGLLRAFLTNPDESLCEAGKVAPHYEPFFVPVESSGN